MPGHLAEHVHRDAVRHLVPHVGERGTELLVGAAVGDTPRTEPVDLLDRVDGPGVRVTAREPARGTRRIGRSDEAGADRIGVAAERRQIHR
jgi:hypothetical protein